MVVWEESAFSTALIRGNGTASIMKSTLESRPAAGDIYGQDALRSTKNLCVGALLEAVRDRTRTVDLKQVNRVLLQPHWRKRHDMSG